MLLRFPRPLTVLVATGTAAITIGLSGAPASADQVRNGEWWLNSLSVTGVWPAAQGAGVTVAVLSDGVVTAQPDLTGAVTTAPAIPAAPVASGQFFGEQGTPIASLIAGRGHGNGGGSGIIGVAPQARILSVPVTLPPDDGQLGQPGVAAAIPAAIAAGIRYAVNHGATVIDLPADPGQPGSTGTGGAPAAAGGSAAEQSAVSYALSRNVVLVAPAGDDAETTDAINYPAAYQGVIAVGAFDSAFDKAPWTSRRNYVTLTAAGAGVLAATNSGGYQPMNSTAASSAVVAGVVALIRSRYPGLSGADIRKALITTTMFRRPGGLSNGSGYGAVNAAKAFSAAAALGTPAKAQAGAGAQPRVTPRPAAAGAGAQSLVSQLLRAGEISAAVLVVLLLGVMGYALIGRRRRPRRRSPAAVAAQWTAGHSQTRYPHAPLTDADRMLDVFAAPVALPDRPAGLAEAMALPAASAPASDRWQADSDLFTVALPDDEPAQSTRSGPTSPAPAGRAVVSGAPPWEPALEPEGEPPWREGPGPQTVAGEVVASGFPLASLPSPDSGPAVTPPGAHAGPRPTSSASRNGWPRRDDRGTRNGQARHAAPQQAQKDPADASELWADPAYEPDQAGGFADATATNQHRSGLPIRQPRAVTRPPMSPSGGSLWERAAPAPAGDGADTADSTDRPSYVWDQAQSDYR